VSQLTPLHFAIDHWRRRVVPDVPLTPRAVIHGHSGDAAHGARSCIWSWTARGYSEPRQAHFMRQAGQAPMRLCLRWHER